MNTETETTEQAQADEQAKGGHDGDAVDCLHCALKKAFDDWIQRRIDAKERVMLGTMGYNIGNVLAGIMERVTTVGPEAAIQFTQGFNAAQLDVAAERAAAAEEAATAPAPAGTDAETLH